MKKRIIPVCLACIMLVSMCRRDSGGIHGVVESDTTNLQSSKKTGNMQSNAVVSSSTDRSKGKTEDRNAGTIKRAARKVEISGKNPDTLVGNTGNERKPGGLLVKPRVDVPDIK